MRMGWLESGRVGVRRFTPRSTRVAFDAVADALSRIPAGARVVDLGAGGRRLSPTTLTVDADPAATPDIVCDLHHVPLSDSSFDAGFCTGTLEHVRDPVRVAHELVRLLRPGGIAYIDVPFIQPFHADPDDFRRWTLPGLRAFCRRLGLVEVASGAHLGPGSALSWIASEYARAWVGDNDAGRVASTLVRVLLRPLVWMDRWLVARPGAHRVASGVYFLGRKSA
jgi:SAM-dependent methyltransferase